MRRQVVLSSDDGEAALEVLAILSYPQRPEYGARIMKDWAAHLRGDKASAEKWSRLEPKLRRADDMVRRSLNAGFWLHRRCAQSFTDKHSLDLGPVEASLRASARALTNEGKEENLLRDYWTQTRPIAHLALASGEQIHRTLGSPATTGWRWSLKDIAFNTSWVAPAITSAELKAKAADELGVIPIADAIRFVR